MAGLKDQRAMFLLVDADSVADHPELPHLLSFDTVEGLKVEHHITLVERPGEIPAAAFGAEGTRLVGIRPLDQFRRIARNIAARPGCGFSADVIERALAFSHIAKIVHADAIVSPARPAFGPSDKDLLDVRTLVTVPEALALIGAYVRQRDTVPLAGTPPIVQERTEVYPLTARRIIPNGQEWWSSCVSMAGGERQELLGRGGAVFMRVGQALRGRDGVHEALRVGTGRSAIQDALYHFDVVLTSSVGALDALARVAHEIFGMSPKSLRRAGWQKTGKKGWWEELNGIAPSVAGVVAPHTGLGAALQILTKIRNSIHSIPLDEYLHVETRALSSVVEHRAMISSELATELRAVGAPLEDYGIFLGDTGFAFLNVGQLTEQLLSCTIEIVGELQGAMLSCSQFAPGGAVHWDELEQLERDFCAALARVGSYPYRTGASGLPAAPSLHGRIMAILHKHRPKK